MLEKHQLPKLILNAWVALRFIIFGVGGFLLLMVCWIALVDRVSTPREHFLHPAVALPLALAAALMILFGVGQWGRWAYLLVFLSSPLVISVLLLLPHSSEGGKEAGVLIFALPLIGSYLVVRGYYRRADALKANASPTEQK